MHPWSRLRPNHGGRSASASSAPRSPSEDRSRRLLCAPLPCRIRHLRAEVSAHARFPSTQLTVTSCAAASRPAPVGPSLVTCGLLGSGSYRSSTDGISYLSTPEYHSSVALLALPALLLCAGALVARIYCCWTRYCATKRDPHA